MGHVAAHAEENVCQPKLHSGLGMSHSMGSHNESSHTDTSLMSAALWRDTHDVKACECIEPKGRGRALYSAGCGSTGWIFCLLKWLYIVL